MLSYDYADWIKDNVQGPFTWVPDDDTLDRNGLDTITMVEWDILYLTLKKKWFDMILSGKKKVENREIKPFWTKRLCKPDGTYKNFDFIIFKNGYSKNARSMIVEHEGMSQGYYSGWNKRVYSICLGNIVRYQGKEDGEDNE